MSQASGSESPATATPDGIRAGRAADALQALLLGAGQDSRAAKEARTAALAKDAPDQAVGDDTAAGNKVPLPEEGNVDDAPTPPPANPPKKRKPAGKQAKSAKVVQSDSDQEMPDEEVAPPAPKKSRKAKEPVPAPRAPGTRQVEPRDASQRTFEARAMELHKIRADGSVFLRAQPLALTAEEHAAAELAIDPHILDYEVLCHFCNSLNYCIQCSNEQCRALMCIETDHSCVDWLRVSAMFALRDGQIDARRFKQQPSLAPLRDGDTFDIATASKNYEFLCVPCTMKRQLPIYPIYYGPQTVERTFNGDVTKIFVFVHIIGYGVDSPSGNGPASEVRNWIPKARQNAFEYIVIDFSKQEDELRNRKVWPAARQRIRALLDDIRVQLYVGIDIHAASATTFAMGHNERIALRRALVHFLGPKLMDKIEVFSGFKMLFLLTCHPGVFDSVDIDNFERRDLMELFVSQGTFTAVLSFATVRSRFPEMRQIVSRVLDRHFTRGAPLADAVTESYKSVAGLVRLNPILVQADEDSHVRSRVYWSTGNTREMWSTDLASDGIIAMGCPDCNSPTKVRQGGQQSGVQMFFKQVVCTTSGCKWNAKRVGPPSFVAAHGEVGTSGAEHRWVWSAPYPLPRMFKPLSERYGQPLSIEEMFAGYKGSTLGVRSE